MKLELQCARDLNELTGRSSPRRLNHARNLHRNRRPARDDVAIAHELPTRSHQCKRIHTRMPPKHAVLVVDERLDIKRGYFFQRHRMPPHVIVARESTQRRAVAREDNHCERGVATWSRERESTIQ